MADGYGSRGIARTYALIFGIAYVAVAILELIFGRAENGDGLVLGDGTSINSVILSYAVVQNLIHWAVGIVVLGSYFAGENAAKAVARVIGIVFVIVTVLGLVAGEFTMGLFGYPDGATSVPISYTIIHAVTAIAALYAGFSGSRYTAAA